MSQDILKAAFITGFLMTWLGYVWLILPILFRFFFGGIWWNSLSHPYSERLSRAALFWSEEVQTMGKSRSHRWAQGLLASGLTLLTLTGVVWLGLRILEKLAGP